MENSLKGLLLAAGTIITCLVISLAFFISREAKDTASNGANQIGKLNAEFAAGDKSIYDGAVVSGSEVLNVIKKFSDEGIGIYVQTGKSATFYNMNFDLDNGNITGKSNNTYNIALDNTEDTYVNPYGSFVGRIVKDANEVITGIKFVQQD